MDKQCNRPCSIYMCIGCGVCSEVCPKNCITMKADREGFSFPTLNFDSCISCDLCIKMCPQNNHFKKSNSIFYMAWHLSSEVLMTSSSGGVFTAIAEWVLNQNGVVVGAAVDPNTREIYHELISSSKQLDKLRLSKYYQSTIRQVFKEVRTLIIAGRMVLFSGTACQIAAIKTFLGPLANNGLLLTMDVLCHGVTSKKVISAYIKDREKKYKKKVIDYKFRVKEGKEGWQAGYGTRMKLFFDDGSSQVQNKFLDTFFVGFNSNIFLRESCYCCQYCGQKRISDFTVADFWGVDEEKVGMRQLYKGVSVLLLNTKNAEKIMPDLMNCLHVEEIDPNVAIRYNLAFKKPNKRPEERSEFFSIMDKYGFDKAVKFVNKRYYLREYIKLILRTVKLDKLLRHIHRKYRAGSEK